MLRFMRCDVGAVQSSALCDVLSAMLTVQCAPRVAPCAFALRCAPTVRGFVTAMSRLRRQGPHTVNPLPMAMSVIGMLLHIVSA